MGRFRMVCGPGINHREMSVGREGRVEGGMVKEGILVVVVIMEADDVLGEEATVGSRKLMYVHKFVMQDCTML